MGIDWVGWGMRLADSIGEGASGGALQRGFGHNPPSVPNMCICVGHERGSPLTNPMIDSTHLFSNRTEPTTGDGQGGAGAVAGHPGALRLR